MTTKKQAANKKRKVKKKEDENKSRGRSRGLLIFGGTAHSIVKVQPKPGELKSIDESLGELELPPDFVDKAREGIAHAETALFEQASVARLRLGRLNKVTNLIEQRLLRAEVIEAMTPEELVSFYLTFHKMGVTLTQFLTTIHDMVSNENRWEYLKRTLEEAQVPDTPIDELNRHALRSEKGKDVLSLVQDMIMDRGIKKNKDKHKGVINITPKKKLKAGGKKKAPNRKAPVKKKKKSGRKR